MFLHLKDAAELNQITLRKNHYQEPDLTLRKFIVSAKKNFDQKFYE